MAETFDCNKVGKLKSTPKHSKDDGNKYVTKLQTQLAEWGYYDKTKIDGDYGPVTAGAVKAFQKKYGLTQDGIFGPKETCPKYNEVINKETNKDTDNTKVTELLNCNEIDKNVPHKTNTENKASVVKKIQAYMRYLGFYSEPWGTFGEFTENAVLRFQQKYNKDHGTLLVEDGYYDKLTCQKVNEAIKNKNKKPASKQSKAQKPQPFVDPYKPNTDNNPIPVEEAQLSIDGIFFRINKVTPNNRYRGGNWKTIDLMQGRKITVEKPAPLEYTLEIYLTNEEFSILDQELDKIGFRVCNVVSTQIVSSKYNISVDVAPQQLTHQKVTMKLSEYLVE